MLKIFQQGRISKPHYSFIVCWSPNSMGWESTWMRLAANEMNITSTVRQVSPTILLTAQNLQCISKEDTLQCRWLPLFLKHLFRPLKKRVIFREKSIYINMWTTAPGFSITNKLMAVTDTWTSITTFILTCNLWHTVLCIRENWSPIRTCCRVQTQVKV